MADLIIAGDLSFLPISDTLEKANYEEYFSEIKEVVDKYQYGIVNLESPIINGAPTPINKFGPNLKASSNVFKLIKYLGFKGVTLANNHFNDQGEQGVIDTINGCKTSSLDYFGGGKNIFEAEQTKIIYINQKKIAIINCCEVEFSIANVTHGGSNPLDPIKTYYEIKYAKENADYVIVIVHGGIEYFQYPTLKMQQTYRFFVDAGADAVINHHQHCFSGYEIYNNAPIVYGLGNFFFPQKKYVDTFWNFGYMVGLGFGKNPTFKVIPYKQCSGGLHISLIKGNELDKFDNDIANINDIIADRELLQETNDSFMSSRLNQYDWIFQPYDSKILKFLNRKGLFPKLFSQNRLDEVHSLINCQSHFDRFNFYLKKKTSKDL